MDRKYIENEHIVDRYLSGELSVREAREFERSCLAQPALLDALPLPVPVKARLARRPAASEEGDFKNLPSATTRSALAAGEEGFDVDEEHLEWRRTSRGGVNRTIVIAMAVALIGALAAAVVYFRQAGVASAQLQHLQREQAVRKMQAPGSVQTLRLQLSRAKPVEATTMIGWPVPPQMLDIFIDATDGKYNMFQITIDKVDEGRLMQLHRVARDSNRELRFKLNSSAFGPGDYLLKFEGYSWRGNLEDIGWLRLDMR